MELFSRKKPKKGFTREMGKRLHAEDRVSLHEQDNTDQGSGSAVSEVTITEKTDEQDSGK